MADEDMFTFFADVKQELGVLLVVIGIPKSVSCPLLSISVSENAIEVASDSGGGSKKLCKFIITGISVIPASCNRLQLSADGSLHIRFKVKRDTEKALRNSDLKCSGASKSPNSWTNQVSDVVSVLREESYVIQCRMCASPIVQNKKFHRVLPSPSEDWFEVSESWWCHGHDHDHGHDQDPNDRGQSNCSHHSYNSDPKINANYSQDQKDTSSNDDQTDNQHDQRDNFVRNDRKDAQTDADQKETIMSIDRTDSQSKEPNCDHVLDCVHYLNRISENRPCVNGSCIDQKRDHDHEANCKRKALDQNRLMMGVADCFVSDINIILDESYVLPRSCFTTDKVCIQCARCRCLLGRFRNSDSIRQVSSFLEGGQHSLQLMLHMLVVSSDPSKVQWPYSSEKLEVELAAFLLTEHETANSFRFIIEMRNEKNALVPVIALWVLDVKTLLFRASSSSSVSVEQECTVSPIPIIKLLYKDCLREQNKSTGQMWYRDLTVQSIELPESTCLSVLCLLIDSTKSLPQSLRVVNDFYLGYLRR